MQPAVVTAQGFKLKLRYTEICFNIWPKTKKAPPKAGLFKEFVVGGLTFAGLIGHDFFAGFLVDHFHGQTHLAAIVKAQQFDPDLLTFFENI